MMTFTKQTVAELVRTDLRLAELEPQLEKASERFRSIPTHGGRKGDVVNPAWAEAHSALNSVLNEIEPLRAKRTELANCLARNADRLEAAFNVTEAIKAMAR